MFKRVTILAMLALLLAACGTTTQTNDDGTATNQATAVEAVEVTEQPTQSGGEDVEYAVEIELGGEMGIPFSFMPTDYGFMDVFESPVGEWDCSASSVSGDATDADDDGIAVNATYTIDCTKGFDSLPVIGEAVTVKKTGTLTMKDADDNDPTSGYTSTGDITYSYLNETFTVEHKFDRSWNKGSSSYGYDHTSEWIWSSGDASVSTKHSHSGTYTPDDMGAPFVAGWVDEQASVENYVDGALEHSVSEEVNLHLNKECSPAADDGEITFTWSVADDEGNEVPYSQTVEFTGCGEYQIKTTE